MASNVETQTEGVQQIAVADGHLPLDHDTFGFMKTSNDILEDGSALRSRLQSDGYLYIKDVIPQEVVSAALERISSELMSTGIISSVENGTTLFVQQNILQQASIDEKDQDNSGAYKPSGGWKLNDMNLLRQPEIQRMFAGKEIFEFFDRLFGEPSTTFDYKWIRPVPPTAFTGFHMDNIYMGKGSQSLLTCWAPIMDIDLDLGGLVVIEGSNHMEQFKKIRDTYANYDVDTGDLRGYAWYTSDPEELRSYGGRFLTSERYEMGDLVVFTMKTFHGSLKNTTPDRFRLSVDMRFQPKKDPTDPRWMGESPGHIRFTPQQRHDPEIFPKTMDDKKCEWGLSTECGGHAEL